MFHFIFRFMFRDYVEIEEAAKDAQLDLSPIHTLLKITRTILYLNLFVFPLIIIIIGYDKFGIASLIGDLFINILESNTHRIENYNNNQIIILINLFKYFVSFFLVSYFILVCTMSLKMYFNGKLYAYLYRIEYMMENVKYWFICILLTNLMCFLLIRILFNNYPASNVNLVDLIMCLSLFIPITFYVDLIIIIYFITYFLVRMGAIEL